MLDGKYSKLPRLFVDAPLAAGDGVPLADGQVHYLRHVLRRAAGDGVRLFNGRDGEWAARLELPDRRGAAARVTAQTKTQPAGTAETHLLFAPLKKGAIDILIEKATELGVTHLHPILTQNTEVRRLNEDRLRAQLVEAAEQCERLDLPRLQPLVPLTEALAGWPDDIPVYSGIERIDAPPLTPVADERAAFLIGPEGGFSAEEKSWLASLTSVRPVSFGITILRAETAALYCLAARRLARP